jgi:ferredoxin
MKTRHSPVINIAVPRIETKQCRGCGSCVKVCYRKALSFEEDGTVSLFSRRCAGIENCGRCIEACEHGVLSGADI